jgi:glutamate formiminotransferase/formiminotetrahydrofolate cyclodeaminase
LGLKTVGELRAFCDELAEATPSPGGGSAAAASGAIGASLLAMVCGITANSKKHAHKKPQLDELRDVLLFIQNDLIENARLDAQAYDKVVEAARNRRENPDERTEALFDTAIRHAADVPLRTTELCAKVLELSVAVSGLGSRSAASDVGTAVRMAEAGFMGAAMNVYINLRSIKDAGHARALSEKVEKFAVSAEKSVSNAMASLELGPRK